MVDLPRSPVEGPSFRGCRDAAGKSLLDVDVLYILVILIVFYMESDGSIFDDFPRRPTDTLETQDFIGIVTERMVLQAIDQILLSAGHSGSNLPEQTFH